MLAVSDVSISNYRDTQHAAGRPDESNGFLVQHSHFSPDKLDAKRSHRGPENIRAWSCFAKQAWPESLHSI